MNPDERVQLAFEVLRRRWWQHFKGGLYHILDVKPLVDPPLDVSDQRLHFEVRYRGWGTNEVHRRPLWEWLDRVEREEYQGYRFTPVKYESPFPEELRPCPSPTTPTAGS